MQISIQCPSFGANINVALATSSGSGGSMCVWGTVSWNDGKRPLDLGIYGVSVLVYDCTAASGGSCPAAPSAPPGAVVPVPIVQGKWCAPNVQVPSFNSGDLMVVYAWVVILTSNGYVPACAPFGQEFHAYVGNPSASNCCSSGPCSGSAAAMALFLAAELKAGSALNVTVPDGKHTGLHTATPVASLKWSVRSAGEEFILAYCPANGLVIQGTSIAASAESIEVEPFTAVFGGGIFGASDEVVVTVA